MLILTKLFYLMKFKNIALVIFLGFSLQIFCQDTPLSIATIPPTLLDHANAVVRNQEMVIDIKDVDEVDISIKRVITVLNKYGDSYLSAWLSYDKDTRIKNQEAIIYDAFGKEIRKFKHRDFKDESAISSSTLFNDNRVEYLDYTPVSYPYTLVYTGEATYGSSIFISPWKPISHYLESVEKSSYKIINPTHIPIRVKEINLNDSITSSKDNFQVEYTATNLSAMQSQALSPSLEDMTPVVKVALNNFSLMGVKGTATDWKKLGKWQYDNLVANADIISPATVAEINSLTTNAQSKIEKAKIIYKYVQDKTRYISIQLGIGGWVPMQPDEVDKLGYGDCKALTNYTRVLLASQNIPSNYAVVWAGSEKKDIDPDFASMQGNHVILNIPDGDKSIWLECTNQTFPFNYLGDFTDDREVLLVKPDGGQIVKTPKYGVKDNTVVVSSEVHLDANNEFTATVKRTSEGVEYGDIYGISHMAKDIQLRYYKNVFANLNNLTIDSLGFKNSLNDDYFTEYLKLRGSNLGTIAGDRLLMPLNIYGISTVETPRYKERLYPVEIERGKTVKDSSIFYLPKDYMVEAIPKERKIENEFGSFTFLPYYNANQPDRISVTRTYVLKDGTWDADSYERFRKFMNQINSNNHQKAVLALKKG